MLSPFFCYSVNSNTLVTLWLIFFFQSSEPLNRRMIWDDAHLPYLSNDDRNERGREYGLTRTPSVDLLLTNFDIFASNSHKSFINMFAHGRGNAVA